MAQEIRHAASVKPITIPVLADVDPDNVDRCQSFSGGVSQPKEDVYELGRKVKVCTDKDTLEATASITQLEYGTLDTFLQLANLSAKPSGGITLSDFDDARTDIYQPGKDEYNGNVEQTLWLQKMVLDSFSLSIDAEERIERTFELSGDFFKVLREGNKYLIFKTDDAPSGTSGNYDIVLNDPAPVEDPNNSGDYMLQVYRIRSGEATELVKTTDYTYNNGTNTLTILSALASDHYRIWYSAASYGTAGDPFVENDIDDCYIKADSVTVLIDDGTNPAVELTRLTAFSIDATLNRIDEGVVGSDEKIIKDVESSEVSVSLSGYNKNSLIEEVLMNQAGQSWGIIDVSRFGEVDVIVKIYEDSTKSTFKIGYKMTGLTFDDKSKDYTANEFGDKSVNLSSDNLLITDSEGDL